MENRNDLKFVSTEKTVSVVNFKTLKHCEKLIKVSNEIKQHVKKIQLLILINDIDEVFPVGTTIELKKIENDVVIITYRQISVKNSP